MGGNMGDLSSKENIAVIIPSFHSEVLTSICIRSFKKFCPSNISLQYIVVENSSDVSYKDKITGLDANVLWINNVTRLIGSDANAQAIEIGLKHVSGNLVIMCHCDVCVTSEKFLSSMVQKYKEGFRLVGTLSDNHPNRIKAFHICGLLVDLDLAQKVRYFPHYDGNKQLMDVGDELTDYCRKNNINHYCFKNTFNCPELSLPEKWRGFREARCINDDNEVILIHFGRGIAKTQGTYSKPDRINLDGWASFCNELIK